MDFYRDFDNLYNRLRDEYKKYGRLIIAVDFDNTLFDYHGTGYSFEEVKNLIKLWRNDAFIYVFTARTEKEYDEIHNFMGKQDIPYQNINEGCLKGFGTKPFYSVLIDDRAGIDVPYRALTRLISEINLEREFENV